MAYDREAMRRKIRRRQAKIRKQFEGEYSNEINELMGLSREEIDKITPDEVDLQKYAELIEVVKVATEDNLSKARLKSLIKDLGEVAVSIASKVPSLKKILK